MSETEEKLLGQLQKLARLRATGPLPTNYAKWVDETLFILRELFGQDAPEAEAFQEAVGPRGANDAFGLPQKGPWGLADRLTRGEAFVRRLLAGAGSRSPSP